MKILVAVDGSKHSQKALQVAAEVAKLKNAQVDVISVVPYIGGLEDHEISPSRRDRHLDAMEKQASDVVKAAAELLKAEGVAMSSGRTLQAASSVPDAIIDVAESEKSDLIIMGSRGQNLSTRFKLGSVASQVVKASPCSVYLVKLPA